MQLFEEYIKEREGLSLLVKESGFASYRCVESECFIEDLYITKDHRGGAAIADIIKELGKIAVLNGCSHLSGVIRSNDPGLNRTIKAALKLGFIINHVQNGGVSIIKELKGDVWAE